MSINSGGPAFPAHPSALGDHDGMALRDYFAAKAMQALLTVDGTVWLKDHAKRAYDMADAMLAERNK